MRNLQTPNSWPYKNSDCRLLRKSKPCAVGAMCWPWRTNRPLAIPLSNAGAILETGKPVRSVNSCRSKPWRSRSAFSMNSKARSLCPISSDDDSARPAKAAGM